jgi:hypothetical protein
MALPTNTLTAHAAIGNREDLSDEVYRIAPTDTPFFTAVEKGKATGVYHEWQTQDLAAPDTSNAVLEGDDATTDAVTPRVRLGNYTQISDKVARVTGTQQAVETAGVGNELDNQKMLKGLELRRDIEAMLVGTNIAKVAGAAGSTARKAASVLSWIKTNTNKGTGGADPAAADGTGTRTDGTQRAFHGSPAQDVLQKCWTARAASPSDHGRRHQQADLLDLHGSFGRRHQAGRFREEDHRFGGRVRERLRLLKVVAEPLQPRP